MAFRLQDLMIDVLPGPGLRLANERCTCAISAGGPEAERELEMPAEEPEGIQGDDPGCQETFLPSDDCPPDALSARAADLVALKAQLRRDLGLSL